MTRGLSNRKKYEEVGSDLAGNGGSVLQPIGAWNTAKLVAIDEVKEVETEV